MSQTIIMAAAAIQFVAIACLVNAERPFHIFMMQFYPAVLALGLACAAFGRFMGWPM